MNIELPNPNAGDPIKAADIRKLSKAIRRLMPFSSPTVKVRETNNGITYDAFLNGAQTSYDHAWRPILSRSEGTTDYITITPGFITVHDDVLIPTISGVSMLQNPRPELIITSATNAAWIYLDVDFSFTIYDDFVTGATATSAAIKKYNNIQYSTSSVLKIPLFIWQRNYKPVQWRIFNIDALARDDGSATSTGRWFIFSK